MKKDEAKAVVEPQEASSPTLETLLDEHRARPEAASPGPVCTMGECLDDRHPTLAGRVLVRWSGSGGRPTERWVPTLQGLPVRRGDRVLMLRPEGADEPVVTGVVDGFARRPTPQRSSAATVELRRDEALRLHGADGRPLLELHEGESGPVLTVLHDDLEIAAPGRLRLRGREVEVRAEQGPVQVQATDDVVLRGEVVKLN